MITLDDLLRLPGASLTDAVAITGADPDRRESVTGYQSLRDLDVLEAPDGARVYLRDGAVVLVYVGPDAVPEDLDDGAMQRALGAGDDTLLSRQGKRATLHVVADRGIAWSEAHGRIGFIEVFPPTTFEAYQREIYREPRSHR